ncbi:MAG: monovalent cation:proton antiporter-2 (CPA2) family protein [Geminicoccaceae bacterium]|nr:monovalent cation:proton antiporter-2 (CPA2) family protein [Geminicoccaceae bacterium]
MSLQLLAAIFLGAAVIAVPIARWLGLGAVLGYLAGGVLIGPFGLRLVTDVDSILHFAEFGVVLLLFVIGLELQPGRLWSMRRAVFGTGLFQVGLTAALLGTLGWLGGLSLTQTVVVALSLALSSTAFALQILAERNELTTRHGRTAFSILLFQDLAVIPILAVVPLLAPGGEDAAPDEIWWALAEVAVVLVTVIVGGRYLLRYGLRLIASTGIREIFTASALLVVIGTALLMEVVDLSMGLGAFLAGVLLAESEYRHELEADIEPFKGLLLGLFFIAVGMSLNLRVVLEQPLAILGLVIALLLIKGVVLLAVGRWSGLSLKSSRKLAATLPQGGEFAFVIFSVALGAEVIGQSLNDLLTVVVTLSMMLTPLLVLLNQMLEERTSEAAEPGYDVSPAEESQVIIAGFGRVGQIVARILRARKIPFTALDKSSDTVDFVARYGNNIYYGDASRLELLRAARADKAEIFVLAIDDIGDSLKTAEVVRKHFPKLKIYARAHNRKHAYQLMDLGVTIFRRETFLSSIDLAREVLVGLGLRPATAERAARRFREHDERRLWADHEAHRDVERMIYLAKKGAEELEEMFEKDRLEDAAD